MTKLKNLVGRTVSIRHRNRHIGFGELNIDSSGLYSVWGLRFAPTDVIAIDPITKPKRDGEMDEWSVGAASVIRLIDPLPNDIAMATAEKNVHNITLPGAGFSPDILLCILIGSWVENGGCWADVIEISALREWARARQLPKVVYNPTGLKRTWLAYLDFFGIGRPPALLLYWQWLSDAPIAQIRHWAERIHQMRGLPSLNRPNNFERFLNYSEFPNSSIELRLDTRSIKRQLLSRDMTDAESYIAGVAKVSGGTSLVFSEVSYRVRDLVLRVSYHCYTVSIIALCDEMDGRNNRGEVEFNIASIVFSYGYCETKSMLAENLRVEFI